MAVNAPQAEKQTVTTEAAAAVSLLDQAIVATPQTERSRAEELIRTLAEEALKGTVTWNKNIGLTIQSAVKAIDGAISTQLAAIMHSPDFQKLEGSWRGLNYLVMNSETSNMLQLKVLHVRKRELFNDLDRAVEFDQSQLFKKVYTNEFSQAGGAPYGALLRDLKKIFDSEDYIKWRSYRDTEDSRFVTLVLPRVLSRLPYGKETKPIEEFEYEEGTFDAKGNAQQMKHDHYCWMSAAYAMGARMTDAFAKYGWCTAIRGPQGGGRIENLPTHVFKSDKGDTEIKCPTEVLIDDRREKEFSDSGFLPLLHYKNTDYAAFFGAQTTQKPKKYDRPEATANAAISSRLTYMMAASRFAHYIKVIGRNMIGQFKEASDVEADLNRWILNYVNGNPEGGQELRAKYPLAAAKVEVREIPGAPGSYNAVAWMRPWLQMEELTTSLRMVARIPGKA